MREIEKIFRAIRCADEDKVTLATYMLQAWFLHVLSSGQRAKLASTWMDAHADPASTSMDANT
ncbi:hypothetical protein Taro_032675 [Colocasia esculenta]|uniref:Uncharacterized protein n=1 Tax=Colocasia esculenta TaxID=4460 RepID=A0A843VVK3_COLES|nr:hypothetical protein [Colocasia esculenta]